jgi:hypothetical protein
MNKYSQLNTMNPDSQIGSKGAFYKLENDLDNSDQESLMKVPSPSLNRRLDHPFLSVPQVIWQCIRSGQLHRALLIASQHHCYWLTACLQGGIMEHYNTIPSSSSSSSSSSSISVNVVERKGNTNRAIWLKTCWKYSEELFSSLQINYTQALSGTGSTSSTGSFSTPSKRQQQQQQYSNFNHDVALLEFSIYSALCCHHSLLKQSKLIQSWSDHLWAFIRCTYQRSMMSLTHHFHQQRLINSQFYPGVKRCVLKAENEYLEKTKKYSTGFVRNYEEIQEVISSPSSYHTSPVTIHLLNLQQSILLGYQAMKNYIAKTIVPYGRSCGQEIITSFSSHTQLFQQSTRSLSRTGGAGAAGGGEGGEGDPSSPNPSRSTILRVYVHYLLWLFYSCPTANHLPALVSYEQLSILLEAYIHELILLKRYRLVAMYTSYLLKSKRILIYSKMMILLSPESAGGGGGKGGGGGGLDDSTAEDILRLGYLYFGKEEMNEITHEVINYSRHQLGAGGGGGTGRGQQNISNLDDTLTTAVGFAGRYEDNNSHSNGNGSVFPFTPMTKNSSSLRGVTTPGPGTAGPGSVPGTAISRSSHWGGIDSSPGFTVTPMTLRTATKMPFFQSTYKSLQSYPTNTTEGVGTAGGGLNRMESLKWLCLRKEESFLALMESNNFMKSLVLEANNFHKYQQINEILTHIITTHHFIEIYSEYSLLEEKILHPPSSSSSSFHEGSLGGGEGDGDGGDALVLPSLTLSEQLLIHNFESQFSLFLFWKKYHRLLTQFSQWSTDLLSTTQQHQQQHQLQHHNSGVSSASTSLAQGKLQRSSLELTRMILGLFDCEGEEEDEKKHEVEMLLGRNQLSDELLSKLVECMVAYEEMWKRSVTASFLSLRGQSPSLLVLS